MCTMMGVATLFAIFWWMLSSLNMAAWLARYIAQALAVLYTPERWNVLSGAPCHFCVLLKGSWTSPLEMCSPTIPIHTRYVLRDIHSPFMTLNVVCKMPFPTRS